MGLSFLNKKSWHTGSFKNMEAVWQAREQHSEVARKKEEIRKKVIEEKYSEELKRIQVEAGLLPESALNRMSWMYDPLDNPEARNNAEAYLLGKTVKSLADVDGLKGKLLQQEEESRNQNDDFLKLHEDPLFLIKKEQEKRKEDFRKNPVNMQDVFNEAKAIIEARKNRNRSRSKDKKSKKHKKKRNRSSSSRSSSRSDSRKKSRRDKKSKKHSSKHKSKKDRRESSSSSSSSSNSSASVTKDKKKSKDKKPERKRSESDGDEVFAEYMKKRLGPLVEFDPEQYKLKFKAKYMFKDNVKPAKGLTADEKEAELKRMKENALKVEEAKLAQYAKDTSKEDSKVASGTGFLNTLQKQAMVNDRGDGLAENLKRGTFFQDRKSLAD